MTEDANFVDVDELRRRVVEPVVKSLVRPDELEEIEVRREDPSPSGRFAGLLKREQLPGSVRNFKVAVKARGEWIEPFQYFWLGPSPDLEMFASDLYVALRDELVESRLSWGEWRDGDYELLGPPQG